MERYDDQLWLIYVIRRFGCGGWRDVTRGGGR